MLTVGPGYTLNIQGGYSLIANQLDHGSNTLSEVFPSVPDGTQLQKWDMDLQDWLPGDFFVGDQWLDANTWEPSTNTLSPGEAALMFMLEASFPLVFLGRPHIPILPVPLSRGVYQYLSRQDVGQGTWNNITGLPAEEGAMLKRINHDTNQFSLYTGGQWTPTNPVVDIGEGVGIWLPLVSVPATEKTWSGLGTNNNFTASSNWNATVVAGDSLFFTGATRLNPSNDFPAGTEFTNLTFNSGAGAFSLLGNSIYLAGNITNNQASGATETIGFSLTPTTTPFVNVVSNGFLTITGAINGLFGLTKTGPGLLTLGGANSFTGAVTVAQGTLRVDKNSALGTTNGTTTVASGATLDIGGPTFGSNALSLGAERMFVAGGGVAGRGAIVSTSSNAQPNALRLVTLTGDATFGGPGPWTASGLNPGRWDIRGTPATAFLSTGGQPYNLTKVGSNQVSLASVTVDPALANIDIQQGVLSFEGSTTSMGNSNGTVTVHPGATLMFVNSSTNRMSKGFVVDRPRSCTPTTSIRTLRATSRLWPV